MTRRELLYLVPAVPGAVFLTGCGQSSVTTGLQVAIAAGEALVSVLASQGTIPPDQATKINNWMSQVSAALVFATTELASTDSSLVKLTKITSQFSSIIQPDLPPGTAQAILSAVNAVLKAVSDYLASIQTVTATARASGKELRLTSGDIKALPGLHARAVALQGHFGRKVN